MDNEKDTSKNINDMINNAPVQPVTPLMFNQNDSIEVNNLITLADSDITPDLLAQLEQRAKAEQEKMDFQTVAPELPQQEDIQIPEGLPGEDGAVNITGEITERPKQQEESEKAIKPKETLDPLEETKLNAIYKKYVIYINKNNEKYIDSLTLTERKELINRILYEQNEISEAKKAEAIRTQRVIKIILAIITFLITVPLIYIIFNVSMEATIQNYKHSKSNFEVLYKESGKIKINK